MRIIVYGAGAIGGVIGGHLARTGNDVVLIARPGHVSAINEHGLRLVTPSATHVLRIPAVTEPGQIDFRADDAVFLTMKAQNTEEAVRDLKAIIEDVPVFCFQNGVRNEEIAARHFPRVYGAMLRLPAEYFTDGEVVSRGDPPGRFFIGRYPKGTDELLELVAAKLRKAGFPVKIVPDVMPYKWGKLLVNLDNASGAITGARGEAITPVSRAVRQEFREVLSRAGIRWIPVDEAEKEWAEPIPPIHHKGDVKARDSTWQSLVRGQGTVETEFMNGEVVRLAKKLGIQAPVNEALTRICQEMAAKREKPGKYTPAELSKMLGLTP